MRFLFLLIIGLSIAACGDAAEKSENKSDESTESAPKESNKGTSLTTKYRLSPFTRSESFSDATIDLASFENGDWNFKVGGSSYQLGMQTSDVDAKGCANSAKGQHIHLIVDDQPYAAKYESSFHYDIADGKRSVLAFLSRSYHESIKTETAYTVNMLKIVDGAVQGIEPITYPMLFYSRPKGVYEGDDTKRVMLDYYMVNTNPDHYVQADINGQIFDLKGWQPMYIEGLPAGDNTIKLSLLDKEGALVRVQNNPVSRTFKLNPTPENK